jgi:hypothetical protein
LDDWVPSQRTSEKLCNVNLLHQDLAYVYVYVLFRKCYPLRWNK